MTRQPGSRLGPYEIVAPGGAGGTREVYRARDTRLGREVALKLVPDALASDPGRMACFEREASRPQPPAHRPRLRLRNGNRRGREDARPSLRAPPLPPRPLVNARFAPDGQAVFYAAAWEGRPRELFQARPSSGGELSFGQVGADLLAVSGTGELAILRPRLQTANPSANRGTLAVLPASGGTPREVAEDVLWADWTPDGKTLAVVRSVGAGRQLEYPLGSVVYRVPHQMLIWPRVSRDGSRVAFFELEKEAFSVVVVDRSGARRHDPRGA